MDETFTDSPDLPDLDDGRGGHSSFSIGNIIPVFVTIGLSLLLYILWFMEGKIIYNYIAFVLLFLGVIAAWFSNR